MICPKHRLLPRTMREEVCALCPDIRSLPVSIHPWAVWLQQYTQHRLQRAEVHPQVPIVLGQRLLRNYGVLAPLTISVCLRVRPGYLGPATARVPGLPPSDFQVLHPLTFGSSPGHFKLTKIPWRSPAQTHRAACVLTG